MQDYDAYPELMYSDDLNLKEFEEKIIHKPDLNPRWLDTNVPPSTFQVLKSLLQ